MRSGRCERAHSGEVRVRAVPMRLNDFGRSSEGDILIANAAVAGRVRRPETSCPCGVGRSRIKSNGAVMRFSRSRICWKREARTCGVSSPGVRGLPKSRLFRQ